MKDYTNERWKVAGTAVTFGNYYKGSVERLEAAGCEVKLNPYGRPLTNEEMIEFASDCDALIVGNDKVPANVIEHFTKMKVIAKHGVGVDASARASSSPTPRAPTRTRSPTRPCASRSCSLATSTP